MAPELATVASYIVYEIKSLGIQEKIMAIIAILKMPVLRISK